MCEMNALMCTCDVTVYFEYNVQYINAERERHVGIFQAKQFSSLKKRKKLFIASN